MLKQKIMKVSLCGAIATGIVSSFEVIKPFQISAQTFGGHEVIGEHLAKRQYKIINVKRNPDTPIVKVDEMTPFARTVEHTAKFTNKKIETTTKLFEISGAITSGKDVLSKLLINLGAKYSHTRTHTLDTATEYGMKINVKDPQQHTALARFIEGKVETTEVTLKNGYNEVKKQTIKTFVPKRISLVVVQRDSLLEKEIHKYNRLKDKNNEDYLSLNLNIYNNEYNSYF
ncbi:hypothetical protein [Bacillus sp. CDB3]|uniref:hypothetical protein n=1 Tax=Bacillus sp. CDB3 TaxID=360310 RepID=UPI0009D89E9D|nr:hypothetical protein [Bacillus sp. CDB3]OQR57434.1 hypothetical protein CDB3_07395 [Bacillus sp. CDB3]